VGQLANQKAAPIADRDLSVAKSVEKNSAKSINEFFKVHFLPVPTLFFPRILLSFALLYLCHGKSEIITTG
jgi:hypothetical protein